MFGMGDAQQPRPRPSTVDRRSLEDHLRRHVEGEVRFDDGSRALYATDASNYRQPPIGVVIPRTVDDVVAAVAVCRDHGAPVLSRGGGTSLAGQCCNVAVVIDFSKHLTRILEIDPGRRTARVQPGVVLDRLRSRIERQHRLTFGPDPSPHAWCTFGGMLGNNSCGVHSVMAGRTADNVRELEVLTYDGTRMRVGPTGEDELAHIVSAGGRRGEIYATLKRLRDRHGDLVRQRYPRIPRRVSGYNLDELLPENGFHVARALVGTEGTCVTILEAEVELVDWPPCRTLVVLGYRDAAACGDAVPRVLEFGPQGLEGIDERLVAFMREKQMHPRELSRLPEGDAWLLVEFGGATREEADCRARELMSALERGADPPRMKLYDDPREEASVWEVRESGLGATARVPGMSDTWPGWEDAAVHPERLGDYLREFRGLLGRHGYHASLYGHFGDACIHCRIDFDLRSREGLDRYRRFLDEASDLVLRHDGSFSGEHGDGQARAFLLPKMLGPELIGAHREFKGAWDPDGRMNPGKVVDPDPPTANLRLGTDYAPWQPATHFRFTEDEGSLARATLRCVGVGKCRRRDDAFMCPSFIVTHDERESTRGRARALFEMLEGEVITDGWDSREVLETLDLCLSCKGCKKECPVGVDMATYKSEFLAHHYAGWRLRPRHAYAMGWIDRWASLARLAPGVANFFGQREPFATASRRIAGVAPRRRLPRFARRPFSDAVRDRRHVRPGGPPVVLYPDPFNDFFHPEVLHAADRVLARLGFHVVVPRRRPPAVRARIHYGMLDRARRDLERLIVMLRPWVRDGISVVGLEPSTVAVFRDELGELMPGDEDGRRLAKHSLLLSEFLRRQAVPLPQVGGRVLLHGHCHQKAVLEMEATRGVLETMGLEVDEPEPGCCGMAGSFGFEADHYDVSMRIGERNLFRAVEEAPESTPVLADGFSCRTQIVQATGRMPLHLAELLDRALA